MEHTRYVRLERRLESQSWQRVTVLIMEITTSKVFSRKELEKRCMKFALLRAVDDEPCLPS